MKFSFKIYFCLIVTILSFLNYTFAQTNVEELDWSNYFKKIQIADSLYSVKNYTLAAKQYSKAFANNNQGFSTEHRYKAAKSWAMIKNADSAISNLKKEVDFGFYKLDLLTKEKAFNFLHTNSQWKILVNEIKKNKILEDKKLGRYKLVKYELGEISVKDQYYRKDYLDIWQKYGKNSKELKSHTAKMVKSDKQNLIRVKNILRNYGWIGYDTIGYNANQTLFLVIQHSNSLTQTQYLPLLKQAVKDKKAKPEELALLEDRILVTQGKKQIYGTQVECDDTGLMCNPFPIEDEKNV